MREKNDELAATQAKIACLHGQLVHALAIQDRAFTYNYGDGILRLRTRLLSDLGMNLIALDLGLFIIEIVAYHHADNFGHAEMPDAFIVMSPLLSPDEDLTPAP